MSDLLKLNNISKRDGDIRAFPLASNLKAAQTGKQGWGEVTIAVNNGTVQDLAIDNVIGILFIVGRDEWEKEKADQ